MAAPIYETEDADLDALGLDAAGTHVPMLEPGEAETETGVEAYADAVPPDEDWHGEDGHAFFSVGSPSD